VIGVVMKDGAAVDAAGDNVMVRIAASRHGSCNMRTTTHHLNRTTSQYRVASALEWDRSDCALRGRNPGLTQAKSGRSLAVAGRGGGSPDQRRSGGRSLPQPSAVAGRALAYLGRDHESCLCSCLFRPIHEHGHGHDSVDTRKPLCNPRRRRCGRVHRQGQVTKDLLDDGAILNGRQEPQPATALRAREDVDRKSPR
jgi:hypothetical protein